MKIELRKFKPHQKLSEETLAFTGEIWLDGQRIAEASNSGQGGPNRYHYANPAAEATLDAYVAGLPLKEPAGDAPDWEKKMGPVKRDVDYVVAELCDAAEFAKRLKRLARTNVLFRLIGDPEGSFRTVKAAPDRHAVIVDHIKAKYPDVVEIY